jgi:hypothetical protein
VAPLGTTVLLEGKSLVAGANVGTVNLPAEGHSSLSVGLDGRVRGRFVVGAGGAFSLSLGTESLMVEGPERHLEVEMDFPPSIRLLRPVGEIEVAEDGEIVLELEIEDDHGLRYIDLILRSGSNQKIRKTIIKLADRVKRLNTKYRWSPESVRLGDEADVQLELEAYDNDTILGPKSSHSDPLNVRILTPMSRHRNAMTEQGQVLDALVDLLGSRLKNRPPSNRNVEEVQRRFALLRSETEDVLSQGARLIGALNRDFLTSKRVVDTYAKIRSDLSNQLLYETKVHVLPQGDFVKRKSINRVTIHILEDAILRVDDLIIEQQLARLVSTGDLLDTQQNDLEKRWGQFMRTRAESSRRGVLDAISQMEEAVRRLQSHLEAIRGKVGDTFINPSSLSHLDLFGAFDKLRMLMAAGDFSEANKLIRHIKSDLGRLMAGLEGGLLSFRTDRFSEGERFLGALLDKIMAVEAGQLQLKRETVALQRRYQERLVEVMRNQIDSLVSAQLKKVNKMLNKLSKVRAPKGETARVFLVRLRIMTRELQLALGQGDLDEARQLAEGISDLSERWISDDGKKCPDEISEIKKLAVELFQDIVKAYPKPGQLFSKRDRRQTKAKAAVQRNLAARTRKAKAWIDEQSKTTRFLSSRARSALGKVVSRMVKATASLEESRIRAALSGQTGALDELARLREDLKRGDQVAPIKSRPIILRARVELPSPDDYKVPPEFRKDVIEAMGGEIPNEYEDAIKKYYENLVK